MRQISLNFTLNLTFWLLRILNFVHTHPALKSNWGNYTPNLTKLPTEEH
ncbi:hypothetical protein PL11201_10027 [Planktothrix sp. PCC 11201]|nr:hypothetical protein PL11201_10027 [Planktothrix sp. PCC 11201]